MQLLPKEFRVFFSISFFFFLRKDAIYTNPGDRITWRVESSVMPTRRTIVTITIKISFFFNKKRDALFSFEILAPSDALNMRFDTNMMMAFPPMESTDR